MKPILAATALLFLLIPIQLKEFDLDYVIVLFLSLISLAFFIKTRKIKLEKFDLGWIVCAIFSFFYIIYGTGEDVPLSIIAAQSLIFLMPLISLATRSINLEITPKKIGDIALWLCIIKLVSYIPHIDLYLASLHSHDERLRFQDFSSVIVVFLSVSAILNNCINSTPKKLIIGTTVILLSIGIAHRSLYLSIALQVLYAISFGSKKILIQSTIAAAALITLALITPAGKIMIDLFLASIEGTDANTSARLSLSSAVFLAGFENPFGNGFGHIFKYGLDSKGGTVYYALQHNSFLTYLHFMGWIPFIAITFSFLHLIAKYKTKTTSSRFLKSAIIGMLVFSYFNMFLEHPIYGFFFWAIYGAMMARNLPQPSHFKETETTSTNLKPKTIGNQQ